MLYKNLIKGLSLFLFVSFVFVGCDSGDDSLSSSLNSDFESPDFAVLDYNDAIDGMIEPDMNNNPGFGQFPPNSDFIRGNGQGGRQGNPMMNGGRRPHQQGRHLGRIFRNLNLSEDQIEAIKPLMEEHKTAMEALHEQLKVATESIMEYGKEERQAIIQQVQEGSLTREEAKTLFVALHEEIKALVDASEAAQVIKTEMCDLADALFANILTIFTDEQAELFNQWLADNPGPCAG